MEQVGKSQVHFIQNAFQVEKEHPCCEASLLELAAGHIKLAEKIAEQQLDGYYPHLTTDNQIQNGLVQIEGQCKFAHDEFKKAFDIYTRLNEVGHVKAKLQLGWMSMHGKGVDKDIHKARALFEEVMRASSDDVASEGAYMLGELCWHYSTQLKVNFPFEAIQYFELAQFMGVELNPEKATDMVILARRYLETGDFATLTHASNKDDHYKKAYALFHFLANAGNREAQFQLGLLYMTGKGCKQSDSTTVKYLTMAEKQGHPEAALRLGDSYMLRSAWSFRKDPESAKSCYTRALKYKNPEASYKLAKIYFDDAQVVAAYRDKPYENYEKHLKLADQWGHKTAAFELAKWMNNQYSSWSTKGPVKKWYERALIINPKNQEAQEWLDLYAKKTQLATKAKGRGDQKQINLSAAKFNGEVGSGGAEEVFNNL